MENRRGNEIFLGVIGVATLIVAIIGATFAYFSAQANSAEGAISATSTVLSLGFKDDSGNKMKSNLIPAYDNIAMLGVDSQGASGEQCVDDNNNNICGVYEFTIGNPSTTTAQQVYARIQVLDDNDDTNNFSNLYFRIYEMNGSARGTEVVTPTNFATAAQVPVEGGEADEFLYNGADVIELDALSIVLTPSPESSASADGYNKDDPTTYVKEGNNVKSYQMVVWLRDTGSSQNTTDSSRSFAAGIFYTTEDGAGGGVSGMIGTTAGVNVPDTDED